MSTVKGANSSFIFCRLSSVINDSPDVCYANDIPFIAIRCVTDTEKHSGVDNFDENCAKASSIAKDITVALLREIKKSW